MMTSCQHCGKMVRCYFVLRPVGVDLRVLLPLSGPAGLLVHSILVSNHNYYYFPLGNVRHLDCSLSNKTSSFFGEFQFCKMSAALCGCGTVM